MVIASGLAMANTLIFQNGLESYIGQTSATMNTLTSSWGPGGYSEPGSPNGPPALYDMFIYPYRWPGWSSVPWDSRALLRFDLQGIPPGTAIASASLELTIFWDYIPGVEDNTIFRKALKPWTEGGVYWTNWGMGGGTDENNPVASPDYVDPTIYGSGPHNSPSFTIDPALIQDWVNNPAGNFGFFMRFEPLTDSQINCQYLGSHAGDPTLQPKLIVETGSTASPILKVDVTLDGYTGSLELASAKVDVLQGNTVVTTMTVAPTATTFQAQFNTLAPGTYTVRAKALKWLDKSTSVTLTGSNTTTATLFLLNGDVNGDNAIGLLDLGLLKKGWGQSGN